MKKTKTPPPILVLLFIPVIIALIVLALSVAAFSKENNEQQKNQAVRPKIVYEPLLRQRMPDRKPTVYSFVIPHIIQPGKEYSVWIEDDNCCRPIGDIKRDDRRILFIEKIKPITLPPRPKTVYEKVEPDKKPNTEWRASKKTEKKDEGPIFYSTIPLYKKELPDGSLKLELILPNGKKVIEIIPPPKKEDPIIFSPILPKIKKLPKGGLQLEFVMPDGTKFFKILPPPSRSFKSVILITPN